MDVVTTAPEAMPDLHPSAATSSADSDFVRLSATQARTHAEISASSQSVCGMPRIQAPPAAGSCEGWAMQSRCALGLVASLSLVVLSSGCGADMSSEPAVRQTVPGYCGFVLAHDSDSAGSDLPTTAGGKALVACMKTALEKGERAVAVVAYRDDALGSKAGVIVNAYRLDGQGGMTLDSARGDEPGNDGDLACIAPKWLPEVDCNLG